MRRPRARQHAQRVEMCAVCRRYVQLDELPIAWTVLADGTFLHYGRNWSCYAEHVRAAQAPELQAAASDLF